MQRRLALSLVNVAVAAAALFVWFELPQYSTYALYGFLGWIVVGTSLAWLAAGSPPVGVPTPASGSATPLAPGAPAGPAAKPGSGEPAIGFCIYCAADLPPDAVRCSACGHPAVRLA